MQIEIGNREHCVTSKKIFVFTVETLKVTLHPKL